MSKPHVVIWLHAGEINYLQQDGRRFSVHKDVKLFESKQDGQRWIDDYSTGLLNRDDILQYGVIEWQPAEQPKPETLQLPPVDFYEVGTPTDPNYVIKILSENSFNIHFTPVTTITGAFQMQSNLVQSLDDQIEGRLASFSFPGYLTPQGIEKIKAAASRWDGCYIHPQGNGFAQWFIVKLFAKRK